MKYLSDHPTSIWIAYIPAVHSSQALHHKKLVGKLCITSGDAYIRGNKGENQYFLGHQVHGLTCQKIKFAK